MSRAIPEYTVEELEHDGRIEFTHETMKAYGGSLPIYVDGAVVATITMSGEPDVVDHETVTEAVRRYVAKNS